MRKLQPEAERRLGETVPADAVASGARAILQPRAVIPIATEWMLPGGLRSADLSPDNLVAFPKDVGRAANLFHAVQPDLLLIEAQNQLRAPVTVKARVLFDAPILALRLPTSGRAAIRHETYGRMEESDESWNLGMVADSTCAIEHHPGEAYSCLMAVLTVDRLRSLLDRQRCPAAIARFLDGKADGVGLMARTSPRLRRIADEIGKNPYRAGMAALYAEGKLYELLAETLTILGTEDESQARISRRDHNAAMMAYDLIRENLAASLSIDDVARQVGLSQRRLAELFQEFFGASPFQCLTRWRLDAGRDLLDQGELSVKQVAYAMGYAHVSSFSQAFTRQFGYPPRTRRRRADVEW